MTKKNFHFTYQWVCFPEHKAIRHAIGSELNLTEEEEKEIEEAPPEMRFMMRRSAAISRKEVVGDYDSDKNMGHAKWKTHYMGDAAEDIALIIATIPDWGSGIACDVGFVNSSTDDCFCHFIEPKPSVTGVTADAVRELITLTYESLPTDSYPDMIITECSFHCG